MNIPNNVILVWLGTNGAIPANYARETSLDGKFIKGAAADTDPNVTGGNATHSHTSPTHTHSIVDHTHTYNLSAPVGFPDRTRSQDPGSNSQASHQHTGTTGSVNSGGVTSADSVTYGAVSNNPPFYEVIFIKSNGLTGLPDNVACLFDNASLPTNWVEADGQLHAGLPGGDFTPPDLRNKYLRGAGTGADAGTTGGSYTNVHDISHTHTPSSHTHGDSTSSTPDAAGFLDTNGSVTIQESHTHTVSISGTAAGINAYSGSLTTAETVEPAYKKLRVIINKTGNFSKPKGIIALWLGSIASIPRGWHICDGQGGTIDMRDKFMKVAVNSSEVGNSGGSNTHTHAAQAHSHTGNAHTHGFTPSNHPSPTKDIPGGGSPGNYDELLPGYEHPTGTTASTTANYQSSNTTGDSANNEPAYRTVAYIQYQKDNYASFMESFI